MKLDTGIVISKGSATVISAVCLSFGQALAQWVTDRTWPPGIVWIVIIVIAIGQGANALNSFLSGAFSDYVKGRANGSATGNTGADTALWKKQPTTPPPPPDPAKP
jgi:hypothetical protein